MLFNDAVTAAQFRAKVDVVATAKTGLQAGPAPDGIGGYVAYGQCDG